MTLTKEDILKHAFVISISNKRLRTFYERMNSIGFNNIQHVIGSQYSNNKVENINITTINIIKYAIKNNYSKITIFEDDAFPVKDFNNRFPEVIQNIPDDVRCLALGYNAVNSIFNKDKDKKYDLLNQEKLKNKVFVNKKYIKSFWGGHSYIMFKKDYWRYIDLLLKYTPDNSKYEVDKCIWIRNNYFYTIRIPLFVQKNFDEIHNVHKAEGNKCADMINKEYNIL